MYYDRPFSSVGEMNTTLLNRQYEVDASEDVLVHLGDVAMDIRDGSGTFDYFQRIGGALLLQGNHDVGLSPAEGPFPVLESCVLDHEGIEFYCTPPQARPDSWDGWAIHGHEHDNNPEKFSFVATDECVDVSVELLDYRPVSLDDLTQLVRQVPDCSRVRGVQMAGTEFDWSRDEV